MKYRRVEIGSVVKLRQGFAINKNTKHHISEKPTNLPLLRIADMKDGAQNVFVKDTIPVHFIAKPEDIIYTRTGQVGSVFTKQYGVIHNNCFTVTSNDEHILDRKYLYYALQSEEFYTKANNLASGAAQPDLPHGAFNSINIFLPPIDSQIRIADILSAYDDLIENNQKQIKLLEEAAQRLYKEWFVALRFPGHENTPIIDGIPQGWAWKSILDNAVFKFVNSRVLPFKGERTYYATADVSRTNIVSTGEMITFDNKPSRAAIQPIPHSVWFARMSNSYKILNCFGENEWMVKSAILSSGFAGFSSKTEFYGFVYQTIASEYFNDEKNRYATGATQVSLTNDGLSKINVLIPLESIIIQYSKLVEPLMHKAELLKNENFKLKEARDRLLPKLMSGEIEV
jgi:type I restriction enzyme S subunit